MCPRKLLASADNHSTGTNPLADTTSHASSTLIASVTLAVPFSTAHARVASIAGAEPARHRSSTFSSSQRAASPGARITSPIARSSTSNSAASTATSFARSGLSAQSAIAARSCIACRHPSLRSALNTDRVSTARTCASRVASPPA
jgi:hypothetical protein